MKRRQEHSLPFERTRQREKKVDKEKHFYMVGGEAQELPLQRRGGVCVPRLRKKALG